MDAIWVYTFRFAGFAWEPTSLSERGYLWVGFGVVVALAIGVDLGVLHRRAGVVSLRRALLESAGWIGLALAFNGWIYWGLGAPAGLEFFTAYIVEKSLSIDNIFLFLVIFEGLRVPGDLQHRVLYYGVAGALVMRGVFVFGGIALLDRVHWVLYLFGAILLFTAVRMLVAKEPDVSSEQHWLLRWIRRILPVTPSYSGEKFLVRQSGGWNATPLLLALVAVETADIVFAVDSVPAVLAITRDTFIAYSSNVFAILGLRALYFALADLLPRFRFLRPGLAAILIFTGLKMVSGDWVHLSNGLSLAVIASIVALTIATSLVWPDGKRPA
jgi:tellurite resistance protein TerC